MVFHEAQNSLLERAFADVVQRRAADFAGTASEIGSPMREYRDRPLDFALEKLGLRTETGNLSMWAAQRSVVQSVFENQKTLVRGARKWGKTYCAAVCAHIWLQTGGRVVVLGPGLDHVRDIFWAQFEKLWLDAPGELEGTCGKMRAEVGPGRNIVAIPTNASPGRARGYHGDIVVPDDPDDCSDEAIEKFRKELEEGKRGAGAVPLLVIIDEGQEIAREVYRVLQGTISSRNVHVLILTNPLVGMSDQHEVAFAAKSDSGWHRIAVSHVSEERILQLGGVRDPLDCEERFEYVPPYFVLNDKEDVPWVDQMIARHDIGDPLLWSDLFGRLSEGNLSALVIPRSALLASLENEPEDAGLPSFLGPSVGIDIGLTRDRCIATFMMDGELVAKHDWLPGGSDKQAQVSIAERIVELLKRWGHALWQARPLEWEPGTSIPGERVHVDDGGMTGVPDILWSMGCHVDRVDFGGEPVGDWADYVGETKFFNRRAEMYWCARRLLQEGGARVGEKWTKEWEQAQWIEFERRNGKILIASKDDIRKLHGRSPDDLDALVLACIEPRGGPVFVNRRRSPEEVREMGTRAARSGARVGRTFA